MAKRRRQWKVEGRERAEWDAALLAQVVLAAARARVQQRRESGKEAKQPKPSDGGETRP